MQTHKSYIPTAISVMCRKTDRPGQLLQVILLIEEPLPLAVIYCFHNVGKGLVYLTLRNVSKLVSWFRISLRPPPFVPCKGFPSRMESLSSEKITIEQDVQI